MKIFESVPCRAFAFVSMSYCSKNRESHVFLKDFTRLAILLEHQFACDYPYYPTIEDNGAAFSWVAYVRSTDIFEPLNGFARSSMQYYFGVDVYLTHFTFRREGTLEPLYVYTSRSCGTSTMSPRRTGQVRRDRRRLQHHRP